MTKVYMDITGNSPVNIVYDTSCKFSCCKVDPFSLTGCQQSSGNGFLDVELSDFSGGELDGIDFLLSKTF